MTHKELIEKLGTGRVQLVSRNKVYMTSPYYVMPAPLGDGSFETGQHQKSGNDIFLTKEEMLGEKALSEEKEKAFPYVINPTDTFIYKHMEEFDLDSYISRAKLILLLYTGVVALNTKEYNPSKHKFLLKSDYVEDKIIIEDADKEYEAMKLIMDSNAEKRLEIAFLLNYYSPEFHIPNPDKLKDGSIRAALIKAVKTDPNAILMTQRGDVENRKIKYLIMKLVAKEVITREGMDFIFNNTVLGSSIDNVVTYAKDPRNELTLQKWINAIDNPPISNIKKTVSEKDETMNATSYVEKIQAYLFEKNIEKAQEVYEKGVKANVKYPKFLALKKAIEALEDELANGGKSDDPHTPKGDKK